MDSSREQLLLERIRSDDTSAFKTLHEQYYLPLYELACKKLGDEDDAYDLLQEMFWNSGKSEPDAAPQLLQANAVDPASKKVNFVFYFDNTSGLFPQRIALKVIRYNLDPNTYDLDGTTDTLAALNPVLPGKIAVPLSIDIADDPFLPFSALSIYTMELRNADTGQLLSAGQFDVSTFSSSIYGFYNFDPNIRNYIISVTATPGIPNDVIAGNAVLSY